MTPEAARRSAALDGLRGVSWLLVLAVHLGYPSSGMYAVDVFFVLSGFLITSLLRQEQDRNGRIDVVRFWSRRFWRLYPALLAMVIAVSAWSVVFEPRRWWILGGGVSALAYVGNIWDLGVHDTYLFQHTWSLGLEGQFYLLFPLVFWLVRWAWGRALLVLAVSAVSIGASMSGHSAVHIYLHVGGIGAGAALAFAMDRPWVRRTLGLLAVPALVAMGCVVARLVANGPIENWPLTLGAILAVPLVAGCVEGGVVSRLFAWEPLRWLGERSYSLYLWHLPIAREAGAHLVGRVPTFVTIIIATALSVLVGSLSYRYIEVPFMRRRKVVPHVAGPLVVVPSVLPRSARTTPA